MIIMTKLHSFWVHYLISEKAFIKKISSGDKQIVNVYTVPFFLFSASFSIAGKEKRE